MIKINIFIIILKLKDIKLYYCITNIMDNLEINSNENKKDYDKESDKDSDENSDIDTNSNIDDIDNDSDVSLDNSDNASDFELDGPSTLDQSSESSKNLDNPSLNLNKFNPGNKQYISDNSDSDDGDDDKYLQKFDKELRQEYIINNHPESLSHNYQEIQELSKIVRINNIIIDDMHKTLPILTKYERTRILGQRAKQINNGVKPLVRVSENIMDGYLIAEMELKEKKIPFIIRRPLPNGSSEYWRVSDLEII